MSYIMCGNATVSLAFKVLNFLGMALAGWRTSTLTHSFLFRNPVSLTIIPKLRLDLPSLSLTLIKEAIF